MKPIFAVLAVFFGSLVVVGDQDKKGDNAEFVEIKVPEKMKVGEKKEVTFKIKNTGTTGIWRRTEHYYALGCGEFPRYKAKPPKVRIVDQVFGQSPLTDDGNRVMLKPGEEIKPGQTKVFRCTIQAPDEAGTYTALWQMLIEGGKADGWGDGWFGEIKTVKIVVEK